MWKRLKTSFPHPLVLLVTLIFITAACTGAGTVEPEAASDPTEAATEASPSPEPTEAVEAEQPTETAAPAATESADAAENDTTSAGDALETNEEGQLVTEDGTVVVTEDDRSDRLRRLTESWNTNWELHTIDYSEVLSGGPPRDGIPSIDEPTFVSIEAAEAWLAENEPVIALEIDGDARAYPLQILTWHEIVNDTVGGLPVVVTFCPLCNSALVFERTVEGETVEFGVSGLLRNSDLIMYDRSDESLWQQFTGEAIVGNHVGKQLTFVPSSLISFADFKAAYPEGEVLSRETGFNRPYGENPYAGYDTIGSDPFLFTGQVDGRLPAMERVVAVSLEDGTDVAYPFSVLSEAGVINDTQNGQDLVVFHTGGTASALGARIIAEAKDVGATGVFDPNLDGQTLTFGKEGDQFVDEETGTTWNILGQAVAGPLAGEALTPIVHGNHFWFSWAAFKPDTIIYQGE